MIDQIDFEELSGQATFCELLGKIHDACMADQKFEPHKTPGTWILPVQILADHLDSLGHPVAADNVRLIIRLDGCGQSSRRGFIGRLDESAGRGVK